jgi:hypothetical protein
MIELLADLDLFQGVDDVRLDVTQLGLLRMTAVGDDGLQQVLLVRHELAGFLMKPGLGCSLVRLVQEPRLAPRPEHGRRHQHDQRPGEHGADPSSPRSARGIHQGARSHGHSLLASCPQWTRAYRRTGDGVLETASLPEAARRLVTGASALARRRGDWLAEERGRRIEGEARSSLGGL